MRRSSLHAGAAASTEGSRGTPGGGAADQGFAADAAQSLPAVFGERFGHCVENLGGPARVVLLDARDQCAATVGHAPPRARLEPAIADRDAGAGNAVELDVDWLPAEILERGSRSVS